MFYDVDYLVIKEFQFFVMKFGVVIVVVYYMRKLVVDFDLFEKVLGMFGLLGVVDMMIIFDCD